MLAEAAIVAAVTGGAGQSRRCFTRGPGGADAQFAARPAMTSHLCGSVARGRARGGSEVDVLWQSDSESMINGSRKR